MTKKELFEASNNWIKIETKKDLPKKEDEFWCYTITKEVIQLLYNPIYKEWSATYNIGHTYTVTHYQPIIKPKPPKK